MKRKSWKTSILAVIALVAELLIQQLQTQDQAVKSIPTVAMAAGLILAKDEDAA
jgi:hypothetical protein